MCGNAGIFAASGVVSGIEAIRVGREMAGFREFLGITVLAGAALAVAVPATGAVNGLLRLRGSVPVSLNELGSIASFTPAIHDPKLSSAYEHAVLNRGSRVFRFTPTSGSLSL